MIEIRNPRGGIEFTIRTGADSAHLATDVTVRTPELIAPGARTAAIEACTEAGAQLREDIDHVVDTEQGAHNAPKARALRSALPIIESLSAPWTRTRLGNRPTRAPREIPMFETPRTHDGMTRCASTLRCYKDAIHCARGDIRAPLAATGESAVQRLLDVIAEAIDTDVHNMQRNARRLAQGSAA